MKSSSKTVSGLEEELFVEQKSLINVLMFINQDSFFYRSEKTMDKVAAQSNN